MNKIFITIVGLSVDSKYAILYKADGTTMTIKQGDPRLPGIVAASKEPLARNETVEVDITEIFAKQEEYAEAEKGTNGLVKFFRVAKKFVTDHLINTESPEKVAPEAEHITPVTLGLVPGATKARPIEPEKKTSLTVVDDQGNVGTLDLDRKKTVAPPPQPTNAEKVAAAAAKMDSLIGNGAQTTDQQGFHKPLDEKIETIVAVNTQTGAVIPDAHKLAPHLKSASKLQDYVGFQKFFERLSAIVSERGHSVEDLMKFLHQGDLPIADDGCIIGYKRLNPGKDGVFTDCHTGRVHQKVGSFVFMRHGLVDPNRRQDCSNGLHIAALSYLRSFSGNTTVVVKINPEDVFAVPEYSHNKMRVAGYHIVAMLPEKLRNLVNSGGSISSTPEGSNLLNNILRGNHIGVIQHVEIGGNRGQNLTITDVEGNDDQSQVHRKTEAKNTTVDIGAETSAEVEELKAEPVVAKDLKEAPPESEDMSQKDFVRAEFASLPNIGPNAAHEKAVALMALKTRTGKTWKALGLTDVQASQIRTFIQTAEDTQAPVATKAKKKVKPAKAKKAKADKPASAARSSSGSPRTIIRDAITNGIAQNIEQILLTKKLAKKGWAALGVTEAEQSEIVKHSK